MFKDDLASFSLTKIICISVVIIFCSAACVLAFSDGLEETEVALDIENTNTVVVEEVVETAIQDTVLNTTEKLEAVVEEKETETITKTYKVKYIDGQEVERQEVSSNSVPKVVAKAPIAKKVTSRSAVTRTEQPVAASGGYVRFTATGYCACSKCCGKYSNGYTASGDKAQAGVTVAMSSKYAFGTQVEIKGMGTYTVQDRGSAIQGNKIDIYFSSHQEAINFGRRTVEVSVP